MKKKLIWNYFKICKRVAIAKGDKADYREYRLGAIGIRRDDVMVCAANGSGKISPPENARIPDAHAEKRVIKKMDIGGVLFVARIGLSGEWRMAKPCNMCETAIRNSGKIKRVYYTIGPNEYGILYV